jgi:hypothetical protein
VSCQTWHIYGFGVETSEINQGELTVERIENLLSLAPDFRKKIHQYFDELDLTEPEVDDYLEFDQDYYHGIAYLLREVIEEDANIFLSTCDSCNEEIYLLYSPSYPWEVRDEERNLTEESLKEMFNKYLSIICDTIPEVDYQSCENGG